MGSVKDRGEPREEVTAVLIVAKDEALFDASEHHVVSEARRVQSSCSRHSVPGGTIGALEDSREGGAAGVT
jgi:hypothetical protein